MYKYGFHVKDTSVFKAQKGLNEGIVSQISRMKNEPEWMLNKRLRALELFNQTPLPNWGPDLSKLDLSKISFYVRPDSVKNSRSWDEVPQDIKKTFERLGIPEAEREAYKAQIEIEALQVTHGLDPVAQKKIWIGKSKKGKDLYQGLDSLIFTKEGEVPSYFSVKQAELLAPFHDWSSYAQKGLPTFNKVPRDTVLDDMAT